ncbi:hypothetical protein QC762_607715 [Podospora pseudocomata]|uniref:Cardiolipin synthase N-terminal domain-containing protein n=5 Tax=Podospora TaxID=5144 RepID=A0ABY6SHX7_PODCO|nr:hypothetical protein QC761_607715 [Podospora bellae-mahoneyi]KAK4652027.1 hypothetical protein QC762_607715 [Podospora pseudocomata]KAK4663339.1 hypothetical protein QC763_607715 [Podospora pseudopauciseta]KAK4671649.1 hypothetical protein QC764_607715 [Podospora pseudoanserina]VBB84461.1 Putative protein of unknown function [Podospora comata]
MISNALFSTLLAQLCWFATFALAAPVDTVHVEGGNAWQYGTGGGIIGLIVLILDIIVFIEVFQSSRPPSSKLLWSLVVFLFPVVGMIIYYVFSNRSAHNSRNGYETLTQG